MIHSKKAGDLYADREEIVVFTLDELGEIAERVGIPVETIIRDFNGVRCPVDSGVCEVNQVSVLDDAGKVSPAALVGVNPQTFVRFLNPGEMTFQEFMSSHPDACIVGEGKYFNEEVFNEIVQAYREYTATLK